MSTKRKKDVVLEFIIIPCNFLYIVVDSGRPSLLPIENDIATLYHGLLLDLFYFRHLFNILYLESFLAHLTQRVRWAIASLGVRHKLFQISSPLKVLDQWKLNLVWIITRVSSFKIMSGDAVHQPTWPLLLKIEHGKIAGFG